MPYLIAFWRTPADAYAFFSSDEPTGCAWDAGRSFSIPLRSRALSYPDR
jgi:hypothetical protein